MPFDLSTNPRLNPEDPTTRPARIIADHVRAAIFLAADGVTPGTNGRDYMLRRFIRRAYLNGRNLGLDKPFLYRLIPTVTQSYGDVYPELIERQSIITGLIEREEERFGDTIEAGIGRLEDLVASLKSRGETQIAGEEVFRLYETYGFPRELTQDIAEQEGISLDDEGYIRAAEAHSKTSGSAVGEYAVSEFGDLKTEFVGYTQTQCEAKIVAIRDGKIVLDRSPFYAESGGQVGDTGEIIGASAIARVLDTKKEGKTWVHSVEIEGELNEGDAVAAIVDVSRRRAIERAHSATHLLHAALREHLGKHVQQRGSLVEADRLRFDFVHFEPMKPEEILLVENTVSEEILKSTPVEIAEKTLAEGQSDGRDGALWREVWRCRAHRENGRFLARIVRRHALADDIGGGRVSYLGRNRRQRQCASH